MTEKYLGIDVGGTEIKYALMTEEEILEKGFIPTPKESLETFIEAIGGIYDRYADQTKVIVMSAPGRIDAKTGFFYSGGALSAFLTNVNAADLIRKRCGIEEVAIENDGKAAGLAEVWKGGLKGVRNGAVIGIGTGIAGAVVIDGKLHRGSHFSAGEFSLLDSNYQGLYLQNLWAIRGCTPNLVNSYATRVLADPATINGRVFFERLQNGDQTAKEVLDEFCTEFVNGIMTLQAVLDADRYCIGGGISQQPVLIETLNRKIDEIYAITGNAIPVIRPEIVACTFHNDANLIGALYHYLYELKQQ
ncbi:MAG: ROK family protein [Solobacterium sp.]|nr:ROK family protein [Solobacterium sp.]